MAIRTVILAASRPDHVQSLLERLRASPGLTVVAAAATADAVLTALTAHRPDLLVLHPNGFPNRGLDLARLVSRQFPTVKFAVLADRSWIDLVLAYARLGLAPGFLDDGATGPLEDLAGLAARGAVLDRRQVGDLVEFLCTPPGRTVLGAAIAEIVDGPCAANGCQGSGQVKRLGEILHLVARGRSNKEVAHQLGIAESTVAEHLKRASAKTGANTRVGLVVRWLEGRVG